MPPAQKTEVVGSISLYGTHQTGFGWLATVGGDYSRMLGTGEPDALHSATAAVWFAADAINDAIFSLGGDTLKGLLEIHIDTPNGPLMATMPLCRRLYFGDLKFGPGSTYTVSAEEIERAAA